MYKVSRTHQSPSRSRALISFHTVGPKSGLLKVKLGQEKGNLSKLVEHFHSRRTGLQIITRTQPQAGLLKKERETRPWEGVFFGSPFFTEPTSAISLTLGVKWGRQQKCVCLLGRCRLAKFIQEFSVLLPSLFRARRKSLSLILPGPRPFSRNFIAWRSGKGQCPPPDCSSTYVAESICM